MPTVAAHTLGCKLNFAETSSLLRKFNEKGWHTVDFDDKADLYIINTCTVTAVAEKKCRNIINRAIGNNPDAIVAVVGCYAQNDAAQIEAIKGVDIVLGNDRKHDLPLYVEKFMQQSDGSGLPSTGQTPQQPTPFDLSYSHADRTRTFFKIQDGCDYFCSYCAIPYARGRSRSATVADTVAVARQIASEGAKEVVLTGINTGTFGQHHDEHFIDLLRRLDTIEGIERYRISSIEPNLLTPEIISFVASSRAFLPHFHIPLQSGSDHVLQLMRRRYDTAFYASLIDTIRDVMPNACIAADIIAGFNGETEEEFEKTLAFVNALPISYLHVFTFSERPGTAALRLDGRVGIHLRREHSRRLHEVSEQKKKLFYANQSGQTRPVLWESDVKNGMMYGFTDNYIRTRRPYDPSLVNIVTPFTLNSFIEKEDVFE